VFDVIRDNGTVAAGALAAAAMAETGIVETDNAIRRDFASRFLTTLHDLHRHGSLTKVKHGRGARWEFAPGDRI